VNHNLSKNEIVLKTLEIFKKLNFSENDLIDFTSFKVLCDDKEILDIASNSINSVFKNL
jgi:hypothetical protein